jgi:hypothetical protein
VVLRLTGESQQTTGTPEKQLPNLKHHRIVVFFFLVVISACGARVDSHSPTNALTEADKSYTWTKVADHAAFPEAYNFPLFNFRNRLWVFQSEGNWYSKDGKNWTKAELPPLGLRTGYQQYVQFNDAIYALGRMEGNYLDLKVGSPINRTSSDLKRWEVIAEQSELPARVFYGATVFAGKIWLFGGFDGKNYYNDVWNSSDGIHWRRVAEQSPWTARSNPTAIVFKNQIWLMGGGIIDGQISNDVWRSADGIKWIRVADRMGEKSVFGFSAVVYDDQIWLVGLNRNDGFRNAVLVSSDGLTWQEHSAPWTPRGGVATSIFDGKLFMTGGKYSVTENGNIKFIYSNDVWYLARLSN